MPYGQVVLSNEKKSFIVLKFAWYRFHEFMAYTFKNLFILIYPGGV